MKAFIEALVGQKLFLKTGAADLSQACQIETNLGAVRARLRAGKTVNHVQITKVLDGGRVTVRVWTDGDSVLRSVIYGRISGGKIVPVEYSPETAIKVLLEAKSTNDVCEILGLRKKVEDPAVRLIHELEKERTK